MKFRPLHDRVVVKRLEEEELTAGGIIIPDTAQEKPVEGKVLAVGSGLRAEDGKITPPTSNPATAFCSDSTAVPRSPSTARNW